MKLGSSRRRPSLLPHQESLQPQKGFFQSMVAPFFPSQDIHEECSKLLTYSSGAWCLTLEA